MERRAWCGECGRELCGFQVAGVLRVGCVACGYGMPPALWREYRIGELFASWWVSRRLIAAGVPLSRN